MKRITLICLVLAIALIARGTLSGYEMGEGEPILCASNDPKVGGSYIALSSSTTYHALFNSEYDASHVENTMANMQEMGLKYIRVIDGPLMSAENTFLPNVQNNINDFLNRAANHNLTVYFLFSSATPWMGNLYYQRTGQIWIGCQTEFSTYAGRQIWGDRIKYVVQQCFASRSQDIIISFCGEPYFTPEFAATMTEYERQSLTVWWTNYICQEVRSVDSRSNHKLTISLVQSDAPSVEPAWSGRWVWRPDVLYNWTDLNIIDMHFYHIDGSKTRTQEFDTVFGWWAQYSTKPIMIGEMGISSPQGKGNEKTAAQDILSTIHHIRNDWRYSNIEGVIIWTMVPYYKTFDRLHASGQGNPDGPFHHLTDGANGYTRFGVSIWYDQYVEPTYWSNYRAYSIANLHDYNENTSCVLMHVPSTSHPNEYVIDLQGQWYRFHRIRVVDNITPYPKDFDVYVNCNGWILFGSVRNNTQSVVDIVSSAPAGWVSGSQVKIVVLDEGNSWSSLSEVYINPIPIVQE